MDHVARGADDGAGGDARVGVAVRCAPTVRARWWHARQLAHRVAGHALSPEAFVEALTAEMLSAVPLDRECEDAKRVPGEESRRNEMGGPSSGIAFAPPAKTPAAFVAPLERDLDSADAFELDARLCRATRAGLRTDQLDARTGLAALAGELGYM